MLWAMKLIVTFCASLFGHSFSEGHSVSVVLHDSTTTERLKVSIPKAFWSVYPIKIKAAYGEEGWYYPPDAKFLLVKGEYDLLKDTAWCEAIIQQTNPSILPPRDNWDDVAGAKPKPPAYGECGKSHNYIVEWKRPVPQELDSVRMQFTIIDPLTQRSLSRPVILVHSE